MTDSLVELRDVAKSYAAVEGENAAQVLRGVNLSIAAGEAIAIIGPSGSGKSTLLNIIGALLPPSSGEAIFEGKNLAGMSGQELARLRNQKIGFIFQSHHLLPQCSALENVLLPTLASGTGSERSAADDRARRLLEQVGLGERMSHRPAQLSGGECQRVAVVRALINQPRIVLADEPTGSLDETAADHLSEVLSELNASEQVAMVMVTHSHRLAARMSKVYELHMGALRPGEVRA